MSFVEHIKVKKSPGKILKLINCIYLSVYFLPQSYLFAYIAQDEKAFQDLKYNKRKQPFYPVS